MSDNYFMGLDGFVWFTGVVEDRNDPSQLGRVKVRCLGFHTEDKNKIPTDSLPWAHVMHPVTDPSMQGMGTTPSFLVEGTWVVGFFTDAKEKQQPIIMGSLPGIPQSTSDTTMGFNDPTGTYPNTSHDPSRHSIDESDVNRLARNSEDYIHHVITRKDTEYDGVFREDDTSLSEGQNTSAIFGASDTTSVTTSEGAAPDGVTVSVPVANEKNIIGSTELEIQKGEYPYEDIQESLIPESPDYVVSTSSVKDKVETKWWNGVESEDETKRVATVDASRTADTINPTYGASDMSADGGPFGGGGSALGTQGETSSPGSITWNEPKTTDKTSSGETRYSAVYPKNHVFESESGHIKEYDDTVGAERIHEYHKAGTFYEIDADGNKVTRIVGSKYEIVAGTEFVNIKGDVNLTIDSNCKTYIKGDHDIQIDGNVNEIIKGTYTRKVTGNVIEQIGDADNISSKDEIIFGNVTEVIGDTENPSTKTEITFGNYVLTIGDENNESTKTETTFGNVTEIVGLDSVFFSTKSETIYGNVTEIIGTTTNTATKTQNIFGNSAITIGDVSNPSTFTETVHGNFSTTIGDTTNTTSTFSDTIFGAITNDFKSTLTSTITGAVSETLSSTMTQAITGAVSETFSAGQTTTVTGTMDLNGTTITLN